MKLIATTTGAIRSFRFTKSDKLSLSLTLFSLFLVTVLHAQTTVSGRVSDQGGIPVADASVSIQGGGGTVTDTSGRYSLTVSRSGQVQMVVSHVGYNNAERSVNLSGGD
ncbi:MAG: carboxypeptidase-like regulatory domain-containing protein, partial [Chitinophagaceae bacterium]